MGNAEGTDVAAMMDVEGIIIGDMPWKGEVLGKLRGPGGELRRPQMPKRERIKFELMGPDTERVSLDTQGTHTPEPRSMHGRDDALLEDDRKHYRCFP